MCVSSLTLEYLGSRELLFPASSDLATMFMFLERKPRTQREYFRARLEPLSLKFNSELFSKKSIKDWTLSPAERKRSESIGLRNVLARVRTTKPAATFSSSFLLSHIPSLSSLDFCFFFLQIGDLSKALAKRRTTAEALFFPKREITLREREREREKMGLIEKL